MSEDPVQQPVLFLNPVPFKRWLSVGMMYVLAALLAYVAVVFPPAELGWLVFLALMAAGAGGVGYATGRATLKGLELRRDGLFLSDGEMLCALDDIASVSRGVFAFKPSNGFLLRLKQPGARIWAPGLYWRLGTFIGVGGVTSKAQADVMAETLAMVLTQRDDDQSR